MTAPKPPRTECFDCNGTGRLKDDQCYLCEGKGFRTDAPLSGAAPAPQQLGTCDKKQYEHCGPHEQIYEHCQSMPPFPCLNWKPAAPVAVPAERQIFQYQYRLRTDDYIAGYREGVADSEAHARKIGEKK